MMGREYVNPCEASEPRILGKLESSRKGSISHALEENGKLLAPLLVSGVSSQ